MGNAGEGIYLGQSDPTAVNSSPPAKAGKQWTVLVLRPDNMWEGSVRDWTYQAHVIAPDAAVAGVAGQVQAAKADGLEDYQIDDYAVLAVYSGHLEDVADC